MVAPGLPGGETHTNHTMSVATVASPVRTIIRNNTGAFMYTGYSKSQLRRGNVGRNASGGKLKPPEKPGERELELASAEAVWPGCGSLRWQPEPGHSSEPPGADIH